MNEPTVYRYGIGNRQMDLSPRGKFLSLDEVRKYLDWCLDDDRETETRVRAMMENLS
jgi:hypothetical protein